MPSEPAVDEARAGPDTEAGTRRYAILEPASLRASTPLRGDER